MVDEQKYGPIERFIRVITFIDLPIKKKFHLFAFGVLFWLLALAAIALSALWSIDARYDRIVHHAVPQDRVVQKIIRNLQSLTVDASAVLQAREPAAARKVVDLMHRRQQGVRTFVSALALGGEVSDYSPETGDLLESLETTSVNDDPQGVRYLKELNVLVEAVDQALGRFSALKLQRLAGEGDPAELERAHGELAELLQQASALSIGFSGRLSELYHGVSTDIDETIHLSILAGVAVLMIAVLLLLVFTRMISQSFSRPIRRIINQIHSLGTGDVDLTQKISITSRDEIGTLSREFNELMDTVYAMTMFKRVIEEDSTLEDVYARLGDIFEREAGIGEYVIYEVKDNQHEMVPVFPPTAGAAGLPCSPEILSNCDLCRAKKTGHDIASTSYPQICKQFAPESGKVHVCVPMIIGGRTGGVVQFVFADPGTEEAPNQEIHGKVFKAEAYIKQALSVIEAKRLLHTLRESALKDPLTGLYNRRFLQDHANHLISGLLRRNKTLGLIMCDLDYFKQVNDQYGHDVGDLVLRETALLINKSVRDSDVVLRFGGEEFMILLTDIEPGEALPVAEKIRKIMEQAKIKIPNGSLTKTLSLGVSEFPGDTDGFWQAIKYADVALYRAKEGGRNRALRFEPHMWTGEEF